MEKFLFATNSQKVLNFFLKTTSDWFVRATIEKKTGLSKAGVNLALKELLKYYLIAKDKKASVFIYRLKNDNPVVKQLKVLKVLEEISGLIVKLKPLSQKIILFGSSSRGEDARDSDIDFFVMTRNKEEVRKKVKDSGFKKIQLITKTPHEFSELKNKDVYFYNEVDRGIILYEEK